MAKSNALRREDAHIAAPKKPSLQDQKIEDAIGEGPKDSKYLPAGFRRHSAVIHKDHLYLIKCLAYWENIPIYEAQYLILEEYFKKRKIKDMPAKRSIIPR